MDRRAFLGTSTAALAGCATGSQTDRGASSSLESGPAVVLVHGAWHGGWCWSRVEAELRREGLRVFTPTLTGLGERAHLRSPVPGLATHVEDIVRVIEWNELHDVVLVGHSYGGMVITGVADQLQDRLHHVVYLDAALPSDGHSMITQNPNATEDSAAAALAGLKALTEDGVWMEPPPASVFGIPAEDERSLRWLDRRLTAHPLPTWTDALSLENGGTDGLARTYIHCTDPVLPRTAFPAHAARIKAGSAGARWRYADLATGHDAMVTAPRRVASEILAATR